MEPVEDAPPPGWYPDPDQVATQRFWDGEHWTDQRAPLSQSAGVAWNTRMVLGLVGAGLVILSCFLPKIDSASVLHIARNSFMSNGDGYLLILLALGAAYQAIRSAGDRVSGRLAIIGIGLMSLAFYQGSDDQLRVVNGLGEEVNSSPGLAVWTLGIGAALITIAGLVRSPRS